MTRRKRLAQCRNMENHPAGWPCFKIVRTFARGGHRTIKAGVSLAEARAHCGNPETSSKTATSSKARRYTERNGAWFDGYDHE